MFYSRLIIYPFQAMPMLIYVGAVMSLLFHLGAIQWVACRMGGVMQATMGTTAIESLAVGASIFLNGVRIVYVYG